MDDLGRRSPQPYGASATLIEPRNETAALERVTLVNLADVEAWWARKYSILLGAAADGPVLVN